MKDKVHYEFSCNQNYILIKSYFTLVLADKSIKIIERDPLMIISADEKAIEFPLLIMSREFQDFKYRRGICHEWTDVIKKVFSEHLTYSAFRGTEPLLMVPSQINGKKNKVIKASKESLEVPVSLLAKWLDGGILVIAPGIWVKMIANNKKMVIAMIKEKVEGISIGS